ncbi:MAG: saccharopine dehydrogenase NADP-binding domain-containing protein, partial [Fimbriimonadaceae bacterium]|nr:saccharopine dehydrogenase NADP-binding domain-containing protein [Chitinophagales bacterium]
MKNVLILGAGKSSASLIQYMLDHAKENNWMVIVGDLSVEAARQKINGHAHGRAIYFNVDENTGVRKIILEEADIVLSLLPAHMHIKIAGECVQ